MRRRAFILLAGGLTALTGACTTYDPYAQPFMTSARLARQPRLGVRRTALSDPAAKPEGQAVVTLGFNEAIGRHQRALPSAPTPVPALRRPIATCGLTDERFAPPGLGAGAISSWRHRSDRIVDRITYRFLALSSGFAEAARERAGVGIHDRAGAGSPFRQKVTTAPDRPRR